MKPMKTINLTDEQYQALVNGESVTITPPAKKWNPCKGNWYVQPMCYREGMTKAHVENYVSIEWHGYQTKELAEWARDKMRTHNRLLAWLSENDDGWREDWSRRNNGNWSVSYSFTYKEYKAYDYAYTKDLLDIYMSEENAHKLCKLLNSGEVVL